MASPGEAAGSAAATEDAAAHKVKAITFRGRRVPIMLQDVNGPCPLLAIANVLLLRNQLQLPAGVGEVSQARLVEMVAGRLLDANSLEGPQAEALSEEQRASLAHNLSDAIGLLPKLCTGIDVNLRFHDIGGFEYTQETAVFDLLDIPLVHGWLVDPQDGPTARAVGQKSYNELVVQLVTALGSAATPKQLTPTGSLRTAEAEAAARAAAAHQPQPQRAQQQAGPQQQQAQKIDAGQLSEALRQTLRVNLPARGDADVASATSSGPASAKSGAGLHDSSRAASNLSMQTNDSMASFVGHLIAETTKDAFLSTGATPTASRSTGQHAFSFTPSGTTTTAGGGGVAATGEGEGEEASSRPAPGGGASLARSGSGAQGGVSLGPACSWRVELSLVVEDAEGEGERPVRAQLEVVQLPLPPSPFESLDMAAAATALPSQRSTPVTPHPSAASLQVDEAPSPGGRAAALPGAAGGGGGPGPSRLQQAGGPAAEGVQAAAEPGAAAAATPGGAPGGSGGGSPGEAAVREALLAQQFLDGHPSQLTCHGLVALQEGLRPNQLAVFFRNNHFSTLFKHEGQLYLLATDEGFQYESDVVWEHLMSVDGDTELVDAEFRPFQPHNGAGAAAAGGGNGSGGGGASAEATAAVAAAAGVDPEWAAQVAAAAAATGEHTHDSDLALAMQLQAEEEERARQEQQRRQQAAARQQEEQRRQQAATQQQQQQRQQQQVLPSQRRPSSGGSSSGGGSARKKKDKKASDTSCTLM